VKMRSIRLLPSLLSADFGDLSRDIAACEAAGADGLHCDLMDGHFVPNITFGPMVVKAVRKRTDLPLNVHLMIENADRYIGDVAEAGASEILVHPEACAHLHRVIQQIRGYNLPAGAALNPHTPLCVIEHILGDIDQVLIMTVNPGFGGQAFIESMLPKIETLRKMADDSGLDLDIAVDGGIDSVTAARVVNAGANVLVAGSSVFASKLGVTQACAEIRKSANSALT
jgi:ribulose-phosphate 3-epimerase